MNGERQRAAGALTPLTLHLMAIYRARQRIADALCAEYGLTMSQMTALFRLWEQPSSSMSDLQAQLSLTTGAVTGVVDRLEALGLVERFDDPGDRRYCLVRLTPEGLQRVAAIADAWERQLAAWLAKIPADARANVEAALGALALVASSVPDQEPREGARRGPKGRRRKSP